jgi:predicted CXXCH cytochrome family protein
MRKTLIIVLSLLLIGASSVALAQYTPGAGIIGSPHDFSNLGSTGGGPGGPGQICKPCHSPHDNGRASNAGPTGLLWNHDVTAATYQMYSSVTLKGTVTATGPEGTSKLCLSCHDGTVAIDAFGDATTPSATVIAPAFKVPRLTGADGGDPTKDLSLKGTHPISIDYTNSLTAGAELKPITSPYGGGQIVDFLENGTDVQCWSCHDVHNGGETFSAPLLRDDVAQSTICIACHIK